VNANKTVREASVGWLRVVSLAICLPICGTAQEAPQPSGISPESPSPQLLVAVKSANGKWGYQDKNGTYVIPPKFVHAEAFHEGVALVTTTWGMNLFGKTEGVWLFGRVGYIDLAGKFVIGPRFAENAHSFSEGVAAFQPGTSSWGNAKWGYLDKTGNWAIKPQFLAGDDFSEGLAAVAVSLDKKSNREKWGYIDQAGKLEIPAKFDGAHAFREGIARVFIAEQHATFEHMHHPKGQWWGCIDKAGEVVKCRAREH